MRESSQKASVYEYVQHGGRAGFVLTYLGFGLYRVNAWMKPTNKQIEKVIRASKRLGYWNAVDRGNMLLLDLTDRYI